MQMNITYTNGHKTKETNYAKLNTKHEAKSTNKSHKFWRLQHSFQMDVLLKKYAGNHSNNTQLQ